MNLNKHRKIQFLVLIFLILFIIAFVILFGHVSYADEVELINSTTFVSLNQIGIEVEEDSNPNHYAFNEVYVEFDPYDLTHPSYADSVEIESLLPEHMKGLGYSYELAEELYGVNSLFLIGLTRLESANGTSKLAIERNNISGYKAYDGSVNRRSSYFKSKHECIMKTAEWLSKEYLSEDGKHYEGLSLWDVNENWASDNKWSDKINNIVANMIEEV